MQSLGHGTTVEAPDGRLFYLCHAYIPGEEFYLSRRPFLSELGSDGQGWIRCVTGAHASISQKTPFKGMVQLIKTSSTDTFESAVRDPSWTGPVSDGSFQVLCKRPFSVNYEVSACLRPCKVLSPRLSHGAAEKRPAGLGMVWGCLSS